MSVTKKIFLGIFIAFMSFCILADGLYLAIKYFFSTKSNSSTFNVGNLTKKNEDGESKVIAPIFEINYYANEDGSGVELFDLKLNTLKNEESEAVFSTGLQIVGGDEKIASYWERGDFHDGGAFGIGSSYFNYYTTFNAHTYYYNVDGDNASYIASCPINDDNYFLITIGDELFRMHTRKNLSNDKAELEPYYTSEYLYWSWNGYHYAHNLFDWNYLSAILVNSVRSLEPGYDGTLTFKFGDVFDYYQYNIDDKTYTKVERTKKGDVIEQVINNYYTIKVNTYYTGAKSASDSIFNMVAGDYKYNTTDHTQTNDYTIGRSLIELDTYDFDYVLGDYSEDSSYRYLKLKDNVREYLANYPGSFYLKISIRHGVLANQGVCVKEDDDYSYFIFDDIFTKDLILEASIW